VNLDKFWRKKKDFICFQKLHLPFQKWGICLICLHCATAMPCWPFIFGVW